jgi:hypothetical protein
MKVTIQGDRAIVHTRATPVAISALPRIEGQRRWLSTGWLSIPATDHNLNVIRETFGALDIDDPNAATSIADEFDIGETAYKPKTKADPHQAAALLKMAGKDHFGLFMEAGTGKTKLAIDKCGEHWARGKITGVIVVTKKGVHEQWIEDALPEHCGCDWFGAHWPAKKVDYERLCVPGGALKWFSISFDSFKNKAARDAAMAFIKAHSRKVAIIVDESHEIKNPNSARHKALEAAKRFIPDQPRMILTGTPIATDLVDEWAQLKWLDERIIGIRYVTTFRAEFCIMGGWEGKQVVGQKNVEEYKRRVDPYIFSVKMTDLGYLPPEYDRWHFDLLPEQKELMRDMRDDLEQRIEDGELRNVQEIAHVINRINQVARGYVMNEDADGSYSLVVPIEKNPRIAALRSWMEAIQPPAIIWARWKPDQDLIMKAFEGAGIPFAQYIGRTKDRENQKNAFIERKVDWLVANQQTAGTGLDGLQDVCRRALYYSNSNNAVERWQSEGRINRRGMTGRALFTDLVAKGSNDSSILANHRRKKNLSDLIRSDLKATLREIGE